MERDVKKSDVLNVIDPSILEILLPEEIQRAKDVGTSETTIIPEQNECAQSVKKDRENDGTPTEGSTDNGGIEYNIRKKLTARRTAKSEDEGTKYHKKKRRKRDKSRSRSASRSRKRKSRSRSVSKKSRRSKEAKHKDDYSPHHKVRRNEDKRRSRSKEKSKNGRSEPRESKRQREKKVEVVKEEIETGIKSSETKNDVTKPDVNVECAALVSEDTNTSSEASRSKADKINSLLNRMKKRVSSMSVQARELLYYNSIVPKYGLFLVQFTTGSCCVVGCSTISLCCSFSIQRGRLIRIFQLFMPISNVMTRKVLCVRIFQEYHLNQIDTSQY
ncbi:hypothetical protein KIN20_027587 [Parelaphostrongylus tenuis]|uniref:Uncharacterized protein n=1 Tax=Parelaphostrongylus tenuis TaxID=148309 RepID=A0AAD5WE93_PARTN|nr:hypothetical protein KIN20_027587 [Parelaphostrongylus tenuis]